jgi:hypothetical protein
MPATGHFAPVRLFMMSYVLLWACLSCVAAQNDATTLQTSQSHCCDVLTELHKFVRERDENDCSTDVTGNCHLLPIMLEFRNRTNMLLDSTTSVRVNGSRLVFSIPTENEHLYKLLVYSFLGRILHEEQSKSADYNTNKWMMFDSNTRTFQFQQSMCDFNKTIYTTLVLASISLLMFFIGVQVVTATKSPQPPLLSAAPFGIASEATLARSSGPVTTYGCADNFVYRQMPPTKLKFNW